MALARSNPTDAELLVLRALWQGGPLTVREVHERLYRGTDVGYTTTLKLLQNLHAKGLVDRDETARQHVYSAAAGSEQTFRDAVRLFMDRMFDGSAAALAMHALGSGRTSPEELAELKALIRRLEKEGKER
jgi:predicted transcriptional regulator